MKKGSIYTLLLIVVVAFALGVIIIYKLGVKGISDDQILTRAKNFSDLVTGDDNPSIND